MFAEMGDDVADMAHGLDQFADIGFQISRHLDILARSHRAAGEPIELCARARGYRAGRARTWRLKMSRSQNGFDLFDREVMSASSMAGPSAAIAVFRGLAAGAGGNVLADMDGDFRLGRGLLPALQRDRCARREHGAVEQKPDQRHGDAELFFRSLRAEADLPADLLRAGVDRFCRNANCLRMPFGDARVVPGIFRRRAHPWLSGCTS